MFQMIWINKKPQLICVSTVNGDVNSCSLIGLLPARSELPGSLRLGKSGAWRTVLQKSRGRKGIFLYREPYFLFKNAEFGIFFFSFVRHTSHFTKVHPLHMGHHLRPGPTPILLILRCILVWAWWYPKLEKLFLLLALLVASKPTGIVPM